MNTPSFSVGDTLIMKKAHPCKSNRLRVLRTGSDIRVICLGCRHDFTVPREKIEKSIKQVIYNEQN